MKKSVALLLSASLLAGSIGSAQADWGHRREYYGPPPAYYQPHHHHHHRSNWIGPAAVLAITGLALGAAAYSAPPPAPVYVAPAPAPVYVAAPPPRPSFWYYCRSSGQYYPYTNACPEGWITVSPR